MSMPLSNSVSVFFFFFNKTYIHSIFLFRLDLVTDKPDLFAIPILDLVKATQSRSWQLLSTSEWSKPLVRSNDQPVLVLQATSVRSIIDSPNNDAASTIMGHPMGPLRRWIVSFLL